MGKPCPLQCSYRLFRLHRLNLPHRGAVYRIYFRNNVPIHKIIPIIKYNYIL